MNNKLKKVLKISLILTILFVGFLFWYKYTFSMTVVESRSVNEDSTQSAVLIVSQGSEFKNAIVDNLFDELGSDGHYVRLTDATRIAQISPNDWDVILIMHTMEIWQPQKDVAAFLEKNYNKEKMIVFATSGSGEIKMDNIDGITGCSILEEAEQRSAELLKAINTVLSS